MAGEFAYEPTNVVKSLDIDIFVLPPDKLQRYIRDPRTSRKVHFNIIRRNHRWSPISLVWPSP
jgi:hypothetical protein